MARASGASPRAAKKVVRRSTTATKAAAPKPVVVARPASVERTEKTFKVSARRSRDIDALIDEAVG
jgi:hypothetical protein